jgi:hypothetical protein
MNQTSPITPSNAFASFPVVAATAAQELWERRLTHLTESWRSWSAARGPAEWTAVELDYCTRLMEDYQEVIASAFASLAAPVAGGDSAQTRPAAATRASA